MSWLRRLRKKISKKIYACRVKHRYATILSGLKKKSKNGEKIRIGFYVVFDSVFPAEQVFQIFLKDKMFDPFILVIPDVSRGDENMFYQLDKTYKTLSSKYKNVYMSYNKKEKAFIDFSDKVDMIFFANPYDPMTDKLYTIQYNSENNCLPLYVSYGCMPDLYARKHIINMPSMNMCWKVFADTKENLEDYIKYTDVHGSNVILSGYCKMDNLALCRTKKRTRKKIIIAPHHTVAHPLYPLSNFLSYHDFFLKLPDMYPDIDFVFRPHPLLYPTLCRDDIWGKKKTDEYFAKIESKPNMIWQNGGDYFDTFVNSDGMIHDCASFILEYLFTGHPCCYMLHNEHEIEDIFMDLGKNCLKQYYQAFNEQQILNFIDNVIIAGKDPLKKSRQEYADKSLKINYPHVSDAIIKHIKECLL